MSFTEARYIQSNTALGRITDDVVADNSTNTLLVGTGSEAGADEDDFHVIGRVREELIRKEGSSPDQPKGKNKKAQKNVEATFQPPTKRVQPIPEPKKVIFFKG